MTWDLATSCPRICATVNLACHHLCQCPAAMLWPSKSRIGHSKDTPLNCQLISQQHRQAALLSGNADLNRVLGLASGGGLGGEGGLSLLLLWWSFSADCSMGPVLPNDPGIVACGCLAELPVVTNHSRSQCPMAKGPLQAMASLLLDSKWELWDSGTGKVIIFSVWPCRISCQQRAECRMQVPQYSITKAGSSHPPGVSATTLRRRKSQLRCLASLFHITKVSRHKSTGNR